MAMQFGTTPNASMLRLALRLSPVIGTAGSRGIGGRQLAPDDGLPSGGIAGTDGEIEGGRVPAADGAM